METAYRSVLDEMTDEQKMLLKQFRGSLDVDLNHRYTDELLLKFLRSKSFNLKEAKKTFLQVYYSRITLGVNTFLDSYKKPEIAVRYEATRVLGFAKDGTLIRFIAAGRVDTYGFIMSMSCFDLCLYLSHFMEHDIRILEEENLKTGRDVTEITYIADLEEFALEKVLHQNVIETGLDFLRLLQDCYPELWRRMLVVNAPKIFYTAFNLFKPVMRSTALERVKIIDKAHTKETLLQYVDEHILPVFLGGRKVDSKGDPMCREFLIFGGKIPKKYYSQYQRPALSLDDPQVRLVNIGGRSMFNLCCVVQEEGSELRFQARSEGGSISISVLYKEFGPDPNDLDLPGEFENLNEEADDFQYQQISMELRSQMHCAQEDAKIFANRPGIYIVRFRNGNWFGARKLYFKYKVVSPLSES